MSWPWSSTVRLLWLSPTSLSFHLPRYAQCNVIHWVNSIFLVSWNICHLPFLLSGSCLCEVGVQVHAWSWMVIVDICKVPYSNCWNTWLRWMCFWGSQASDLMAIMTLPPSFMYVALPSPWLFLATPIHMSLSISNQHAQILICLLSQS